MGSDVLQQMIHGYSHGHSLLAASIQLDRKDMDLIGRLSDLSGTLGPQLEITPYLTLYPLPSKRFFAIGRTWPDQLAPRAGCVLTHTILVPIKLWTEESSPIRFSTALRAPDRGSSAGDLDPLHIDTNSVDRRSVHEPFAASFVQRYFGEGLTPIAWFGALDPELAAWRVIQALWPSLRAQFACCTFALQPRTLENRPFDLLFAPIVAFSRFGDFAREHIVDGRAASDGDKTEPWIRSWSDCIFSDEDVALSRHVRSLAYGLDPYPTAIRQVFFFLQLEERASNSATAALGALDLLDTLALQPPREQDEKRALAYAALRAIERMEPHQALEVLYLLCQRLESPSIAQGQALAGQIRHLILQLIRANPKHTIAHADSLTARHADAAPRLFLLGVGDAVLELLGENSHTASILIEQCRLGERLIVHRPEVAAVLLRAARQAHGDKVVSVLVNWSRTAQSVGVRSALRRHLLPEVGTSDDAPLLEELLRDLGSGDVPEICTLIETQDAFRNRVLSEIVRRCVGERHASSVRQWASSNLWKKYQTASVVAAAFAPTADGLSELLAKQQGCMANRQVLLAAFLERITIYSLPTWLESRLSSDPSLWSLLLTGDGRSEVVDVVLRLVRGLRRSAIARAPDARIVVGRFGERAADVVQEHAVRQLIIDFLERLSDADVLQEWLLEPWVIRSLVRAAPGSIRTIVAERVTHSSVAWTRAWEMVKSIPASIAYENGPLVQELISVLLESRLDEWSVASSESWRQLLAKVSQGDHPSLELCGQALHFALRHTRLPLAEIAGETFFPVHEAAMKDQSVQPSLLSLVFGDWDKAKDLRRSLVDSFTHSDWDPSQFALSAREPWLLRKLSKRMLRQWHGFEYLERAYSGLNAIATSKAKELAGVLSEILRDPQFTEDWD